MPDEARLVADLRRRARTAQYAGTVPSPCRDVCRMGEHGYCEGCYRTLDEIAGWGQSDDARKRAIWQELPGRAAWALGTPDADEATT